jgi:hypothetical protein
MQLEIEGCARNGEALVVDGESDGFFRTRQRFADGSTGLRLLGRDNGSGQQQGQNAMIDPHEYPPGLT